MECLLPSCTRPAGAQQRDDDDDGGAGAQDIQGKAEHWVCSALGREGLAGGDLISQMA